MHALLALRPAFARIPAFAAEARGAGPQTFRRPITTLLLACAHAAAFSCAHAASPQLTYTGSGFFVTAEGHFVTSYHVVRGAERIGIRDVRGQPYDAAVVKFDKSNDLALLKVDGVFKPLPLADSRTVKRGLAVVTVGFPNIELLGLEPKLSEGIVSGLSGIQDEPSVFQVSVPTQHGNSGGPLVNMDGNVIGIVASKLSALYMLRTRGSVPENVNYAIKSNYLDELMQADEATQSSTPAPNRKPAKDLVELSERIEQSIGLVFAVGVKKDPSESSADCARAASEETCAGMPQPCKTAGAPGDVRALPAPGNCTAGTDRTHARDYSAAETWFRLAAEQGNDSGAFFLAAMYYNGYGVPQDRKEAFRWYRSSAAKGNTAAQYMVGLMYWHGDGVPQSYANSYVWASVSALQDTASKARAEGIRDDAAAWMNASDVAAATQKIRQCVDSRYRNCEL